MSKETRRVSIVIEDLGDINKVLVALENLFKTLIDYYIEKEDLTLLASFVLACSSYFGHLLMILGYNEENTKEDKK
jgi:hypothetical protein